MPSFLHHLLPSLLAQLVVVAWVTWWNDELAGWQLHLHIPGLLVCLPIMTLRFRSALCLIFFTVFLLGHPSQPHSAALTLLFVFTVMQLFRRVLLRAEAFSQLALILGVNTVILLIQWVTLGQAGFDRALYWFRLLPELLLSSGLLAVTFWFLHPWLKPRILEQTETTA